MACSCLGCVTTGSKGVKAMSPHVPLVLLRELCEEWSQEMGLQFFGTSDDGAGWGRYAPSGAMLLAQDADIPYRRMFDINRGYAVHTSRGKNGVRHAGVRTYVFSFGISDKLVAAMRMVHEWTDGRLKPFYGPIPISRSERERGAELPVEEAA